MYWKKLNLGGYSNSIITIEISVREDRKLYHKRKAIYQTLMTFVILWPEPETVYLHL